MSRKPGFTIVELLIVIVVIAILAAISVVAYNGIQNRAADSAVVSDLAVLKKKIEVYKIDNSDVYPIYAYSARIQNHKNCLCHVSTDRK